MAEIVMREKPTEVDVLFDLDEQNKIEAEAGMEVEVADDVDTSQESSDSNIVVVEDEKPSDPIAEETKEEVAQEKTYKPKKKKLAHERVKQVLYEKKAMQNAAYSLLEENKALKREKEQLEKAARAWQEDSTKIRADIAKNLYMQAIEEGDPEKQAEAQRYMIQYETELKEHQKRPKNQQTYNYDEDVYDYVGDVAPPTALDEFLLENEWMDQSSAYYDPDKAELAIEFEKDLLRAMKREGLLHLKNTKEYFDAISNHVEESMGGNYGYKYEDPDEGYEEEYAPQSQARSNAQPIQRVAPVNRSNTAQTYTNTPPKSNSKKIVLTPEQREWALRLEYGYPVSDAEKIKRYAAAIRSNKD